MGKKNKHSQDKLHKTVTELKSHHAGFNRELELSVIHRRLKFDSCCLSLDTITDKPVGLCDEDGWCYVFNCDLIVKFLEKFHTHPITGNKVTAKDLIELKFHKNSDDQCHCPVTFKLFNQLSKIVVNKKTGHVYSYEAYHQLNFKPNNFNDLLTDEPFEKDDIVTIQDPDKADAKLSVTNFYYVKNKLKIDDNSCESNIRDIEGSSILKSALEEYKRQSDSIVKTFNRIVGQNSDNEDNIGEKGTITKLDKINSAGHSDGTLARSVTSTVMPATSVQTPALLSNEQILYPKIKKKGYVQLVTNLGPINLELYCDRTPKTCHNFMLLASRGYYDNTCFHRLVKNFILQGGDPTGTGSGGQSAWGTPFQDEYRGDLKHIGRGVLAMANSGPGTNKSQFYITFRGAWENLDGKHTVFGRVVGGDETLDRIEAVEVDKKDRPKTEVKILRVVKYVDPFEETEAALEEERKQEADNKNSKRDRSEANKTDSPMGRPLKKFRSGVGAFIDLDLLAKSSPISKKQSSLAKDSEKVSNTIGNNGSEGNNSTTTTTTTSLASKLASVGGREKAAKSHGDFSDW